MEPPERMPEPYQEIHHEPLVIRVTDVASKFVAEAYPHGFDNIFITQRVWEEAVEIQGAPRAFIPNRLCTLVGFSLSEIEAPARSVRPAREHVRRMIAVTPVTIALDSFLEDKGEYCPTGCENTRESPDPPLLQVQLKVYYTHRRQPPSRYHSPLALLITMALESLKEFPPANAQEIEEALAWYD